MKLVVILGIAALVAGPALAQPRQTCATKMVNGRATTVCSGAPGAGQGLGQGAAGGGASSGVAQSQAKLAALQAQRNQTMAQINALQAQPPGPLLQQRIDALVALARQEQAEIAVAQAQMITPLKVVP